MFDRAVLYHPWFAAELGCSLIVVFALAAEWFNRPGSIRSQTTAFKYHAGLCAYRFALALGFGSAALLSAEQVPPVVVVVAMLAFRRAPLVWRFDVWVRQALHQLIGARTEAGRLAETLTRAELQSPDAEREVTLVLRLHGFDPDEETIPAAEPTRRLWLKAAVLFHQVRGWVDDPVYQRFVAGAATEFDVLRQRFDQLSMKVVRVSDTVDRLALTSPPSPDDGHAMREIITRMYADLREDVAFFFRNACLFAAHGVLAVSLTARGRRSRLRHLGFSLEPKSRPTSRVLAWAFGAYVAIFLAFRVVPLLLTGAPADRAQIWNRLLMAVMIATIQVVSIMMAILPKFRFGFANEDIHGHVPLGFVLGAGLAATAVSMPIQIWFFLLTKPDWTSALHSFTSAYPWLLMPFVTAATFAYLVQDSRWSTLASRAHQRLADGAVFTVTMVVATLVSDYLLQANHPAFQPSDWQIPWLRLAIAIAIGVVIGAMVPAECRRRYLDVRATRPPVRETAAPSGPLAAARP